jgi:glycosyltransferase involved in cell wall biosynthesis
MKLAAVIPCFRVRRHIVAVVEGVLRHVDHVFVVDDCCPELTGDLVLATFPADQVTVLRHRENQGVGAATVTGYSAAFAAGYEVAVKLDGDGQMDPGYIPDLVQPLLAREADYTKGNRFYQREHLTKMPTVRMFGNSILSLMTKFSSGYWNIIDPTNGFTALHAVAAQEVDLAKVDHRYFFESDMLFRLNIARAVVKDVPMPAIYGLEHSNLSIGHVLLEFPVTPAESGQAFWLQLPGSRLQRRNDPGDRRSCAHGVRDHVRGGQLDPERRSRPGHTRRDRDSGDAANHPGFSCCLLR